MEQEVRERIRIFNEKGILEASGGGFHSPLPFAVENLYYAAWSSRYLCSRQYHVEREYLDFYSVIYVMEGTMEVQYEGETIRVRENEVILLDFRKPHSYRAVTDRMVKWEMVFRGNASDAYYSLITEQSGCRFKAGRSLKKVLGRLMTELESPFPRDHRISADIHMMLGSMLEQNEAVLSPPIQEAVDYIGTHYGAPLQISEIAEQVSLSRFYFTRLFRKETGRTPNEYLAEVRLNAARELLTEKRLPVAEIADRCGFVNASHFTRFFREKTGQTPAAFRNSFTL